MKILALLAILALGLPFAGCDRKNPDQISTSQPGGGASNAPRDSDPAATPSASPG